MVNVEPFDELNEKDCRWSIEGYGVVFEDELVFELRKYFADIEDVSEDLIYHENL